MNVKKNKCMIVERGKAAPQMAVEMYVKITDQILSRQISEDGVCVDSPGWRECEMMK